MFPRSCAVFEMIEEQTIMLNVEFPLPRKTAVLHGPTQAVPPMAMADRGADNGNDDENDHETGIATKVRPKTKRPSLYRVLLLNDDYTPMEFVVMVLQDIFNKSSEDAWQVMMHVHKQGVGECGVFPYEVAETKVTRVMDAARKNQHPLQCVMEKK